MAQPQRMAKVRSSLRLAAGRDTIRSTEAVHQHSSPPAPGSLAPDLLEVRVRIAAEEGVIEARRQCREVAARSGFRAADCSMASAIVYELATNILLYAGSGEIAVRLIEEGTRIGMHILATDAGPGIGDLRRALTDGFSTSGRMGLGLPGVKRLADDFSIASKAGTGTQVSIRKWRR